MLKTSAFLLLFLPLALFSQVSLLSDTNELSLIFIGDIMGHGPQIQSAYDAKSKTYKYDECFKYIKDEISDADITIANLEVTLGGSPYKGYPCFSSPDALPEAAKDAGIDFLITANNHSCDRKKKGIIRTIDVLDTLKIPHTGTFKNKAEREKLYPYILEENGIKLALLVYTYGTNGIPVPSPCIVNLIDRKTIEADLEKAKNQNPDKIIVMIHWGAEYQSHPNAFQKELADFCFEKGADIIIGGHPHVLQKMEWEKGSVYSEDQLIVYSLGNFISNQRKRKTDGGAFFKLKIKKADDESYISEAGYYLSWVYRPIVNGKKKYYILVI